MWSHASIKSGALTVVFRLARVKEFDRLLVDGSPSVPR